MNRCNILTAIDLLQFAITVNQTMIATGQAITGKPFTEQEILDLKAECIAADEAMELLNDAVRTDIKKEQDTIALMATKVFL